MEKSSEDNINSNTRSGNSVDPIIDPRSGNTVDPRSGNSVDPIIYDSNSLGDLLSRFPDAETWVKPNPGNGYTNPHSCNFVDESSSYGDLRSGFTNPRSGNFVYPEQVAPVDFSQPVDNFIVSKEEIIKMLKDLKEEIKKELKEEIKEEIKKTNRNNIANNITNNKTNKKTTIKCCFCKNERNIDCFHKTSNVYKDCCSEKVSCSICNAKLNGSSLKKHMRMVHNK